VKRDNIPIDFVIGLSQVPTNYDLFGLLRIN